MSSQIIKCSICNHRINPEKDEDIYVDRINFNRYYHYECLRKEIEELLVKKQGTHTIIKKGAGKIRREIKESKIPEKLMERYYHPLKKS